MALIYGYDLLPIIVSTVLFSALATTHRVLLPNQYSSFLQFKQEEDTMKTVGNASIRMLYLIIGSILLNSVLAFTCKQIVMGIFCATFLNVWPTIIQYQLLKLNKSAKQWLLLGGYICFIIFSAFIGWVSIKLLFPVLAGEEEFYWLDNQAVSIMASLFLLAVPITAEGVIAKFSCVVINQTVDTFLEEVYIIEKQLDMDYPKIDQNACYIDKFANENDINVQLVNTILFLEIFYRNRLYYSLLERLLCKFFKKVAIKRDISVGLSQIKVSTAAKILCENPNVVVGQLTNDEFNIDVCCRYLKYLINDYELYVEEDEFEEYNDVFDYIACEYVGGISYAKSKTVLVYSAVLRSVLGDSSLEYSGSEYRDDYHMVISPIDIDEISYESFKEIVEKLSEWGKLEKCIYVENVESIIEIRCKTDIVSCSIKEYAEENGMEVSFS